MADQEQLEILRQGVEVWNKWREENPSTRIDLHQANLKEANLSRINLKGADLLKSNLFKANLSGAKLSEVNLSFADLAFADLSGVDLSKAYLGDANLREANLSQTNLSEALLVNAELTKANLFNARLSKALLVSAHLSQTDFRAASLRGALLTNAFLSEANLNLADLTNADLISADLSFAHLKYANLSGANLAKADLTGADLNKAMIINAHLDGAQLVGTYVDDAIITGSSIYSINVWDLIGEFKEQKDLVITSEDGPVITVDNIKIAQFIYLILNNEEIRDVIDSLTSKSVLILGRYTGEGRKEILDALRDKLREYNLLPIVFDFDRPTDRDYTETVQTLAGLSLFVIVDVTNPKSTPLEMEATVKQFKIPYVPIIDLNTDKYQFAMMVDLQKSFHWVLPTFGYSSKVELLENVERAIISRALEKHNELREQKAAEQKILTIDDLKSAGKVIDHGK